MIKKKLKKKKIKKKIKVKKNIKIEKKQVETARSAATDEKVVIKKIRKQPTEKRQYSVNQSVVYPKHGVGKVLSVEKAVIGDIEINFYKVLIDYFHSLLFYPNMHQHT